MRRARIGVLGKFAEDWNYALVYDFGGTSDGFGGTGAVGPAPGTPVGFLPGGAVSGIENAYLTYTGFKPFGGKLALEIGVMDVPYTMDEATSSNDMVFMERASSGIIAQNIAAGDFRSAIGARWYNDTFWARRLCDGPDDRRHALVFERHPQRHDGASRCRRPAPRRRSSAATTTPSTLAATRNG